jgi:superfamily I DNA/RNA helicase
LTERLVAGANSDFGYAVVDEAQDVGIGELRFLAALVAARPDGLFLTGDLGERILQQPFSWKSLGVDIRGRSHTLRINYRTSHQIRSHADRLLPLSLADVDGNAETRRGAISVFNSVEPMIETFADSDKETAAVGKWLAERMTEGVLPHEIGVFVRTNRQLRRARDAVKAAGAAAIELTEKVETTQGSISIGTMHLAKGLEFRAVAVMTCDDEVLPLQKRIESVADEADLDEVYNTERHLLYVACTRAHLLVTGVAPTPNFSSILRKERDCRARGAAPIAPP